MIRIVLWTLGIFLLVAVSIGAFGGWLGAPEILVLGLLSVALAIVIVRRKRVDRNAT